MTFKSISKGSDGSMAGQGNDTVGDFNIKGTCTETTINFVKQYVGKHSL